MKIDDDDDDDDYDDDDDGEMQKIKIICNFIFNIFSNRVLLNPRTGISRIRRDYSTGRKTCPSASLSTTDLP